jgi:hypothetical protein
MWLYPVPVILSMAIWFFLFFATGWFALGGSLIAGLGILAYYVKSRVADAI